MATTHIDSTTDNNGSNPADGVVRLVDAILDRAIASSASDVHFEPLDAGLAVRLRVDAQLHEVERIPAAAAPNVVARLKVLAGLLTYRIDLPQEGSLSLGNGHDAGRDIRVSTIPTIRGERVVLRLLDRRPTLRGLRDLGLSDEMSAALARAVEIGSGLILLCGPAGSGKTTTLYALLQHLRAARPMSSVITIEDPVEYRLDGITQIQVQPLREMTYARALRSILRQDPETILLGEIRDAETAHLAAEAALTGHLLLTTLHGGTPAEAVLRLLEMGVPAYQVTSSLRLAAAQRLLRTLCVQCRSETGRDDEPFESAGFAADRVPLLCEQCAPAKAPDRVGGCDSCLNSGYRGRTACGEWLEMTGAVREAILACADADRLSATSRVGREYVDMRADAQRHLRDGRTTNEEIQRVLGTAPPPGMGRHDPG